MLPDTMEYSISPFSPLSASDANTWFKLRKYETRLIKQTLLELTKGWLICPYLHDIGVPPLTFPNSCSVAPEFKERWVIIDI